MPGGLVTSFFTYGGHDGTLSDEIDFEYLTNAFANRTSGDKYSLTSWNDWDSANPDPNNTARRSTATIVISGLDVTTYNTLLMRWLPDRTEWLVNGQLVRSSTQALPDDPMSVSLNLWAPESSWVSAYSAGLQPTSTGGSSYFYDLDSVVVRSIPEPSAVAGIAAVTALFLRRTRKTAFFAK
jgi:beta-glucanase (GH16 family)